MHVDAKTACSQSQLINRTDTFVVLAGENIGVHEGPRSHSLGVDATPFVEPLLSANTPGFLSYHPEIPYSKGASLWHMLEAFWESAGQDAFRVQILPPPTLRPLLLPHLLLPPPPTAHCPHPLVDQFSRCAYHVIQQ